MTPGSEDMGPAKPSNSAFTFLRAVASRKVVQLAGLALFDMSARRQRPALLQQILRLVIQDVVVAYIFLLACVAVLDIDVSCVNTRR